MKKSTENLVRASTIIFLSIVAIALLTGIYHFIPRDVKCRLHVTYSDFQMERCLLAASINEMFE